MGKGYISEKPQFAETGNKVSPSSSKISLGWVSGEQPPHEWENQQQNEQDTRINHNIRQTGIQGTKPGSKSGAELSDKLFYSNKGWHNPLEDNNGFSYGSSITDSVVCWDYTNNVPMLIFFNLLTDLSSNIIKKIPGWNTEDDLSTQVEDLAINPTFTIDSSAKGLCCADEDYLYIYCRDNSTLDWKVLKFSLNPWNGTPIDEYTISPLPGYEYSEMIIANEFNIAFLREGSGSNRLGKLDKAFTTFTQGDGNYNTSWDINITGGLVSDGNRLYFLAVDTTPGDHYMCSANVSDLLSPTTPSAAIQLTSVTGSGGLLSLGNTILIYVLFGGGTPVDGLYAYSRSNDRDDSLHLFVDITRLGTGNGILGFDGLNVIPFFNMASDLVYSNHEIGFLKIPSLQCVKAFKSDNLFQISPIPQAINAQYASAPLGRFLEPHFDGNDMWIVHRNGLIQRVCSIGYR